MSLNLICEYFIDLVDLLDWNFNKGVSLYPFYVNKYSQVVVYTCGTGEYRTLGLIVLYREK